MNLLSPEKESLLNKCIQNNEFIKKLQKENLIFLTDIIKNITLTGKQLITNYKEESFFGYSFSGIKKIIGHKNIFQYFTDNQNIKFFISNDYITEINFIDSLDVYEEIELIEKSKNQYVIELTFKSKRKNLRDKIINRNKFRFVYSIFSGKTTCRILNE